MATQQNGSSKTSSDKADQKARSVGCLVISMLMLLPLAFCSFVSSDNTTSTLNRAGPKNYTLDDVSNGVPGASKALADQTCRALPNLCSGK